MEEALAQLLASYGYRFNKDLVQLHASIRDRFKDLMAAYVSGDRGEELAFRAAIYYEAMEEHIEDEEKAVFTEILGAVSKARLSHQVIKQVFEEIVEGLGEGFHGKMLELVSEIENRLSKIISGSGAAAINAIPIKPYERHALIKKNNPGDQGEGYINRSLNDHEPIPLYYELIHTEAASTRISSDQNSYRAEYGYSDSSTRAMQIAILPRYNCSINPRLLRNQQNLLRGNIITENPAPIRQGWIGLKANSNEASGMMACC